MVDILHKVGIKAPVAKVYAALATIAGLAGWWTTDTTGDSKVGGTITFRFKSTGGKEGLRVDADVVELIPNEKVRWRVAAGPPEWIGTDLEFVLAQRGELTIVLFGHRHWRDAVEFTHHCSTKWATFMLSLRELVETGTGKAAPHDLKIDDWN